jgi:hypothetical protein
MTQVGFEPTIPVLERAKTVYALSRVSIVRGCRARQCSLFLPFKVDTKLPRVAARNRYTALDRAATVIGRVNPTRLQKSVILGNLVYLKAVKELLQDM